MGLSLYETSVPVFDRSLQNLDGLLVKAAAHTLRHGLPAGTLMALRLHPDMLPLAAQIDILVSGTQGAAARLAGRLAPTDDNLAYAVFNRGHISHMPASIEAAREAIAAARTFLATVRESDVMDPPGPIQVCMNGSMRSIDTRDFLLYYVLPNLYFHTTIVYALLRAAGVDVGKADFEGLPVYRLSPAPAPAPAR